MSDAEAVLEAAPAAVMSNSENVPTRRTVVGRRGGALTPFDSASASAAVRLRWERVSAAARRGIEAAGKQVPDIKLSGPVPVIEYAVSQHMLNAFDPSGHGSAASFKLALDLAYPKPEREVQQAGAVSASDSSLADLDRAALDAVLAALRARLGRE